MIRLLIALLLVPVLAFGASTYRNYYVNNWCGATSCSVYWPMNETAGTTLTNNCSAGCALSSASAYNLTTHATPTLNQAGVNAFHAGAIAWAGTSSQYANVNATDSGSGPGDLGADRTFMCWTKKASNSFGGTLIAGETNESAAAADQLWSLAIASADSKPKLNIFNNTGAVYQQAAGSALSVGAGTWYFITGTWEHVTPLSIIYVNGVSAGSSSATSGTINGALNYFEMSRTESDASTYYDGTSQDCAIYPDDLSATSVLTIYNAGVTGNPNSGWWIPVKYPEPELPRFRNDDYFKQFVSRGYNSGLYTSREPIPHLLRVGFDPWTVLPAGNVGADRR